MFDHRLSLFRGTVSLSVVWGIQNNGLQGTQSYRESDSAPDGLGSHADPEINAMEMSKAPGMSAQIE